METSRFSQIGWKRLGKSATWLHIMIVSGTRPVPVSFRSCLSIGAVHTPMNGGATIGTPSERTLPAPPLSSPWKTTCCNKSMAPHGRTNSSASWTAIRKFLQRKWDSPRIGDHSHCGHDDRCAHRPRFRETMVMTANLPRRSPIARSPRSSMTGPGRCSATGTERGDAGAHQRLDLVGIRG